MASNVLNDALPAGGVLSMGLVENAIMNKTQAASDAAASVVSNVINDSLPACGGLSMGVVENDKMNETRAAADDAEAAGVTTKMRQWQQLHEIS